MKTRLSIFFLMLFLSLAVFGQSGPPPFAARLMLKTNAASAREHLGIPFSDSAIAIGTNATLSGIQNALEINSTNLLLTPVYFANSSNLFVANAHQGYAFDGSNHYAIHTDALYKYNAAGTLTASNTAALTGLHASIQHLSDGAFYDGKLYIPAELYDYANYTSSFQRIAVYSATNLALLTNYNISAQNRNNSGLCIVPSHGTNGIIYTSSFVPATNALATSLAKYDLSTFAYLGTMQLAAAVPLCQGVTWRNEIFYLASETDKVIYQASKSGNIAAVHYAGFPGLVEGVDFFNDQFAWLIDGESSDDSYVFFFDMIRGRKIPTETTNRSIHIGDPYHSGYLTVTNSGATKDPLRNNIYN